MRYRVLGPVEVHDGSGWRAIGAAKWRVLLAVLLLRPNRVVAGEELIDELWGADPPATAVKLLQIYVGRLRRVLGDGRREVLVTRPPGYLLRVGEGELDTRRFRTLSARGRAALDAGQAGEAAELLASALALWRGPALADVPATGSLGIEAARLETARLVTVEARLKAELARGRHLDVLSEAEALVAEHPLREGPRAALMLALYRAGRPGEALACYREGRRRLVDELGLEPGPTLKQLERQILAADPALGPPARRPRVEPGDQPPPALRQLPPDLATFAGRAAELERLQEVVAGGALVAIDGAAGVGKSALAVHAAHVLAGRFPDAQLYASLHGTTPGLGPAEPGEVLARWLRLLGVAPRHVPGNLEEATARYRSLLAGRRVLVVLDDAACADQVHPLLPAATDGMVLVASRQVLAVDGAAHVHLGTMATGEAVELLERLVGRERLAADPGAVRELVRCCGHLPLALRVAAARLAARPEWPVRALAECLADERRRLDELRFGELAVRGSFEVGYQALRAGANPCERLAARLFELLGLVDGPDVGVAAAAALAGEPAEPTERALDRLADAQLVQAPSPGRYRQHDLVRLFARECAGRLPVGDRRAAVGRLLRHYGTAAKLASQAIEPGGRRRGDGLGTMDAATARGWLEAERANLLAAARQAAAEPSLAPLAVELTDRLEAYRAC